MQVISFNANGIRACRKRGFFDWLSNINADIICLQELKAQANDLIDFNLDGYYFYYHTAEKKGYSGVGIYTKVEPLSIKYGLGWHVADSEGRYVAIEYDNLIVASIYMPSGTSGEIRQNIKYEFLDYYYDLYLQHINKTTKSHIICGDWNIAHKKIDLKNWRTNQKNSGFLPKEREWFSKCLAEAGLVDAFRVKNQLENQYTWWTYRGKARENNVGWRIDYQMVSKDLQSLIKDVSIYKDQVFSDHAPLLIDYDYNFG